MHTGLTRNKQYGLCSLQRMTDTGATWTVSVSGAVTVQISYFLFFFISLQSTVQKRKVADGASGLAALLWLNEVQLRWTKFASDCQIFSGWEWVTKTRQPNFNLNFNSKSPRPNRSINANLSPGGWVHDTFFGLTLGQSVQWPRWWGGRFNLGLMRRVHIRTNTHSHHVGQVRPHSPDLQVFVIFPLRKKVGHSDALLSSPRRVCSFQPQVHLPGVHI